MLKRKYEVDGKQLKASGDEKKPSFYLFEGHLWNPLPDVDLRQAVRVTGLEVTDKLHGCLLSMQSHAKAKELAEEASRIGDQLKRVYKARQQLQKSANANSICASAKDILWDKHPNLLAVGNGVIDLVTGEPIMSTSAAN